MRKRSGFTLIEIILSLAVLAIILGIIATQLVNPMRMAVKLRQENQANLVSTAVKDWINAELVYADNVKLGGTGSKTISTSSGQINSPHSPAFFNGMLVSINAKILSSYILEIELNVSLNGEVLVTEVFSVKCINMELREVNITGNASNTISYDGS